MINFANAKFIKSVASDMDFPSPRLWEVLFLGRSNVGKSSIINALCNKKSLAFVSKNPGHTTLLNYYLIDDKFYLVDAPGYGFSSRDKNHYKLFASLMDNYFVKSDKLKFAIVLLDIRRRINEDDKLMIDYLVANHISYRLVFTKYDQANQQEKAKAKKMLMDIYNIDKSDIIFTSSKDKVGLEVLKETIEKALK